MKKCRYADQYKAIHPPKCNKGDPCDTCKAKFVAEDSRRHKDDRQSYIAELTV